MSDPAKTTKGAGKWVVELYGQVIFEAQRQQACRDLAEAINEAIREADKPCPEWPHDHPGRPHPAGLTDTDPEQPEPFPQD